MPSGHEQTLWVIKNRTGEELGPYSTEAVIGLISAGGLIGDEKIKKYPYGKWMEISKESQFYDSLLAVLEEATQTSHSKIRKTEKPKTEPDEISQIDQETQFHPIQKALPKPEVAPPVPRAEQVTFSTPAAQQVLDLSSPNVSVPAKKKMILPLFLVGISVLLGLLALVWPDSARRLEKPHLLFPRSSSTTKANPASSKQALQKVISSFLQDSYDQYLVSQNSLVNLIEQDSQNLEARGLLCLVYKELWPFVMQDSADFESVNALTRATRSLDPVGINGIYCEVSRLMIFGKFREARGVLDHSLNQPSLSSAPVLYSLKAEILSSDREVATAALYAEKAKKLWPEWVKPQFDYASNLALAGQVSAAFAAYQEVLRLNPKHKKALVEQAILQAKSFQQKEQAYNQLIAALHLSELIPRPIEARAYLSLAQMAADKKDGRKSLEFAKKSYELNPGDNIAKEMVLRLGGAKELTQKSSQTGELVYLGDQYYRSGDCLAAQAEYKAAYELETTNGVAAMKAAKCLWQLNQSQEAILWLNKAIVADKKLLSAYVLQADYYSQKYNYVAAIQVLNKASQQNANQYEVIRGYGMVEYRRNNLKEALAYLQRAFKTYENDGETLVLLAKTLGGLREYREASKYAVRAVEVDGTSNEAQLTYAKVLAQLNGVDSGISYLKNLISRFSYTLDFRLGLAELHAEAERYRIAQQLYEQILDADPRNKKAFLGLAEALRAQGLFDKALKSFLDAAILDPTDAEGIFKAGMVYLEKDKYADAIKQFQRAVKINPLFPRLNYYMGKAYFLNGDYAFALQASEEERKLNPNLADSYLLAAEVYTVTKQFNKCAEEYQQAIKLRPQGAELYVKLARCYRQGGSPDIAENMLNIAANQESGLPEIYKEQGAIYESRGDARSAVSAYNKYLALSPNAPDRNEIENRILKLSSGK